MTRSALGHGPNEASVTADCGNPQLLKELRVSKAALDSCAAKYAVAEWSRLAERLGLPEREMLFQVVKGLAANLPDKAIERALDISRGTLRRYMDRLFKHFNTRSRGDIAMKAVGTMIKGEVSEGG